MIECPFFFYFLYKKGKLVSLDKKKRLFRGKYWKIMFKMILFYFMFPPYFLVFSPSFFYPVFFLYNPFNRK